MGTKADAQLVPETQPSATIRPEKKIRGSLNQLLLIVHDHLASMPDRTRLNRSAFDGETMRCRPTDWYGVARSYDVSL